MRVCLATSYDLSVDGGVNRHILTLANELRRLGDEVEVIGPASGEIPDDCRAFPGVVAVPVNGSVAHIGALVSAHSVREFLASKRFDVVHAHEPIVPGPARYAAGWTGAPVVGTFHTFAHYESPFTARLRSMAARPLRNLSQGIAVSEPARRYSEVIYRGPTTVIPNGICVQEFTSQGAARVAGGPLQVLFAGRFGERRKGFRYLMEAAALLKDNGGPPMEFVVVGSGPRERFEPMARGAQVTFCGRVGNAALAERYRSADIFCAPSTDGESFGIVLIEAMAAGCPVVASDIPGYAEAADGAAWLVPPADPELLAKALVRVATDTVLRDTLRARGRRRAGQLDWSELAPQVRSVYQRARGSRHADALAGVGT